MEIKEKLLSLIGKDISIETIITDSNRVLDYSGKLLEVGEDYIIIILMDEGKLLGNKVLFPFHSILSLSGYSGDIF